MTCTASLPSTPREMVWGPKPGLAPGLLVGCGPEVPSVLVLAAPHTCTASREYCLSFFLCGETNGLDGHSGQPFTYNPGGTIVPQS